MYSMYSDVEFDVDFRVIETDPDLLDKFVSCMLLELEEHPVFGDVGQDAVIDIISSAVDRLTANGDLSKSMHEALPDEDLHYLLCTTGNYSVIDACDFLTKINTIVVNYGVALARQENFKEDLNKACAKAPVNLKMAEQIVQTAMNHKNEIATWGIGHGLVMQ